MVNWQDRENPMAGGAELHLHETFGRLAARGHRVTLLVSGWEGGEARARLDGMDVLRVGRRYTFPLRVRGGYRALRSGAGFDLVVENVNKLPLLAPAWMHEPVVALVNHLFGATAFREAPWPVAATVWSVERLLPLVYRRTPFHAVSESTADDLAARGIERGRIEVIPGGIDHGFYRPDPEVERFPEPTLVYVGRLKRYKGLDVVIRALAGLRECGIEARLLVAGSGDDRSRLEEVAGRAAPRGAVRFLGYVSEEWKRELLRRAWTNVYPSPKEGWGLTNIEAAACGTPTVASDSPGLRESVLDGRTGFLVAHDDPAAWTRGLARLCADAACRERLARGAAEYAARFSWERTAEETEASLRSILAARRGAGGAAHGGRASTSRRRT
ncbi:MAG TPA: glycosyltransferase family 4 protein [Gemmatimonadota bacterium]|nr:glycosyltransferase family 4 protein [Gemmatimonadota bacterium]